MQPNSLIPADFFTRPKPQPAPTTPNFSLTSNPFAAQPAAPSVFPALNPPATPNLNLSQSPIAGNQPNMLAMTVSPMVPQATPAPAPQPAAQPNVSNQPSLSSLPGVNQPTKNFSVADSNTYTSDRLSPGALQDLMQAQQQKQNAMINGTNLDGSSANNLIPSDSLYGQFANKVYQSSLYSPEEQAALQQYSDATSQINSATLAQRRQIQALKENGNLTTDQANADVEELQRRSNINLADLATQQSAASLSLDVLGKIRSNQTTALQNAAGFIKPQEVSPGSTLYSPVSGPVYTGSGASPATLVSTAQQLKQNDLMTGNVQMNPDGTINDNYYYGKAQQMFSSASGQGGMSGSGNVGGSGQTSGPTGVPQQVQTYLNASGGQYINDARVPANQREMIKQLSAQNGVPYLEQGDVNAIQSLDYTKENLNLLNQIAESKLSAGATGRIGNIAKTKINDIFQTSPELQAFNQARDTAIKTIQSLVAGQGSGFRLTGPEIITATNNMPNSTDSLQTARVKMAWTYAFLASKENLILHGLPNTPFQSTLADYKGDTPVSSTGFGTSTNGKSNSGGSIINTKLGPVDNSWF